MINFGRSFKQPNSTRAGCALAWALVAMLVLAACRAPAPVAAPAPTPYAKTLTLYNWVDYMPQSVLDAFAAEYGIEVQTVVYETQEEAIGKLYAGEAYDLIVLSVEYIPALIADGQVAPLTQRNLPNSKNIPANFRALAHDPGNHYAIPYHWGTTGLLVRNDLVQPLPTRWADLWDPQYEGKVAIWPLEASLLPIGLKKLGYSVNSENKAEVEAAFAELRKLRESSYFIGNDNATVIQDLAAGKAVLAYGWAYDALLAQEEGLPIAYVLPEEGSILWSDYLLIPASSQYKTEAELFLDFLLRPEIGAQLVEESYYPVANDAALALLDPEILANPVIYPPADLLTDAEMTLPLSDEGKRLRNAAWQQFVAEP